VLNCRETTLKNNITIRFVRFIVVLLGLLVLELIVRPSYSNMIRYLNTAAVSRQMEASDCR